MHKYDDKAIHDLCEQFKKIPETSLMLAKGKYKSAHDVDQEIKKINENIDNIMKATTTVGHTQRRASQLNQ